MKCIKHPHSSDAKARKCHDKTMRIKVARKERTHGMPDMIRYILVKYSPPLEVKLDNLSVFYFFRGEVKQGNY